MLRRTRKTVMVCKVQVKCVKSSFDASLNNEGFVQDDRRFCAASNHFYLFA